MMNGNLILPPDEGAFHLKQTRFNTSDIIRLMMQVEKSDRDDVQEFAKQFAPNKAGLKALYDFVNQNFAYQADPLYNQWVQTPSYLWHSKQGDCKSYTVFISNVLHWMGLKRIIRFANYTGGRTVKHVYPIAILPTGERVVMDVVYEKETPSRGGFNIEKPTHYQKDRILNGYKGNGLYVLRGTEDVPTANQILADIADIERELNIPDSIITDGAGDVTEMTSGQLDRVLMVDRLEAYRQHENDPDLVARYDKGIQVLNTAAVSGTSGSLFAEIAGSSDPFLQSIAKFVETTETDTKPAVADVELVIAMAEEEEDKIAGKAKRRRRRQRRRDRRARRKAEGKGVFRKVGKVLKKVGKVVGKGAAAVGKAFTKVWKKLLNFIFKTAAKVMGPYFLFTFLKGRIKGKNGKEVRRRAAQQQKTLNWIAKVGKLDKRKLSEAVRTGISKKTGATPEQILAGKKKISGPGVAEIGAVVTAIISALSMVLEVIGKISALFKKDKDGDGNPSKDNAPDMTLLDDTDLAEQDTDSDTFGGGGSSSSGGSGAGSFVAVAAGLGLAVKAFG